ncbi:Y-family DNA polymerase [Erythrobacter sp. Alg231-14]|uniref:Y-family DNA polymerase n=1 Tax=Erythrobacter sp. Alg231-14 TaxID=1922225 RepID=UPI00307B837E
MAIWCARLSVDRWRLSLAPNGEGVERGCGPDAEPTVLITETAHGPRVDAVNDAGALAGAQPGMMLADARTLCPQIQTAPADPAGDLAFLEKLAIWAQRWGPWSALDPPDGVLVDITAAAHLFGGERRLLDDVDAAFAKRKLTVRAGIAPTAGAAWAMAHYGAQNRGARLILGGHEDPMRRLADFPVAALRLDGDVLTVLRRLGLKRLGDLADITQGAVNRSEAAARDALHRRFRNRKSPSANPLIRLDQILGRVPEPLLPVVQHTMPLVQRRLMEPLRHRSLLDQVLADLATDMARELEGRGEGARRLDLGLWRVDGEVIVRRLEMAAATREPAHINRLFAEKLEGIDAGFGIETVRLRASWAEPMDVDQRDVEEAAERHGTSLAACLDRLSVRLGPSAVRRPIPYASHLPERSQIWHHPLSPESAAHAIVEPRARPLKLLDRPERIAVLYASPDGYPQRFRWRGKVHEVNRVEGPERIAPEWWREKSTVRLRDYYRIEDDKGRRYWMYRHGLATDGRGGMPDWFLQGLYA